jgi:hypothetical protein
MVNAYCEVADVKVILRIMQDFTDSDDEIESCITSADAWINGELDLSNLTVPSPTPELIKQSSQNFAAWFFRRRADPPVNEQALFDLGVQFLAKYVQKNTAGASGGNSDLPIAISQDTG